MPFLAVEGAKLHYETNRTAAAKAPWLTLVNGFSRTWRDFKAMGQFFSRQGFHVLAFDNRGAGETEVERPFTFEDTSEDIRRLWQALNVEETHLLGISFGGSLAMSLATQRPRELKSLILCSTAPKWELVKIEREFLDYFSPAFAKTHGILIQSLQKEVARTETDPALKKGAQLQRQAMKGFDLTGALKNVAVPTLVLHGGADRIVDPKAADLTASLIPRAEKEIWEGVGHLFLAECPKRFYDRVQEFSAR